MALATNPITVRYILNRPWAEFTLFSGISATGDSGWFEIAGFWPLSFHITATNATVQLRGSLATAAPSGNGFQLGTNITSATAGGTPVVLSSPVRYVKAMVTARTGGTITAKGYGVRT